MSKVIKYSNPTASGLPFAISRRDFGFEPLDRIFDEMFSSFIPAEWSKTFGVTPFGDHAYPKVNVVDYDDHVEIEAELAGYAKSDISVEVVEEGVLCITGNKSTKTETGDDKRYLRRELKRSHFSRSFTLGDQLDQKSVTAKFDNGILYVTINKLQKTEPQQRTKVEIK